MLINNPSFRLRMPESSHKDVKLWVASKPFSTTYATDKLPSMDSGFRHPCRNDGNGAIMTIAANNPHRNTGGFGTRPYHFSFLLESALQFKRLLQRPFSLFGEYIVMPHLAAHPCGFLAVKMQVDIRLTEQDIPSRLVVAPDVA